MQKLEAAAHRVMPWKNGGGTTTEIARWPPASSLDDFGWLVSLAQVEQAGPFSLFAGVDRTIALVEGQGMTLDVGGRGEVALEPAGVPLAFPGELAVTARLARGAVVDFNAMTRRGAFRHFVSRVRLAAPARLAPLGDAAVVLVARGATDALAARDAAVLETGEVLALDPGPAVCDLLVVDLWRR